MNRLTRILRRLPLFGSHCWRCGARLWDLYGVRRCITCGAQRALRMAEKRKADRLADRER
jgi:hypothetical protein